MAGVVLEVGNGRAGTPKTSKPLTLNVLRRNPVVGLIVKLAEPPISKTSVVPISTFTRASGTAMSRIPLGCRVRISEPLTSSTPGTAKWTFVARNANEPGAIASVIPGSVFGASEVLTRKSTVPETCSPSRPTRASVPVARSAYLPTPV